MIERAAVVVVDAQVDYLGAPGLLPAAGTVVAAIERLVNGARAAGTPVWHVFTTVRREDDRRMPHWRAEGRWHCVAGTPGHAPPPSLAPLAGEPVVDKTGFSPFVDGDLAARLRERGVETVILCGVHLHACVRSAALDAYQRGLGVIIADDAVASDDPLHAAITRRYLAARGVGFRSVDELLGPPPAWSHRPPRDLEAPSWSIAFAGRHEVAAVVTGAAAALPGWRALGLEARAALLARAADRLLAEVEPLARAIAEDVGKPIRHARGEVGRAAALLRAGIAHARRAPVGEQTCGPTSATRRVPLGVIAAITPWNNPLAIPVGKLAPALLHGNTVVWKPSPYGARVAGLLESALDLPAGVLGRVDGDHGTAGHLLDAAGVDGVTLTGNEAAGFAAADACARRRVPLQAELGGNNAALVWEDADLETAATTLAAAAFGFAGQRCTANRRIVVDARVAERFWRLLGDAAARLPLGDPLAEATEVGPLISAAAVERVRGAIARGAAVARAVVSPHQVPGGGAYLAPALLLDPPADHEVVQEETFGPLAVVQVATDLDHGLRLVNGVRQGLAAAVFTKSSDVIDAFMTRTRAGILKVGLGTADADAEAPFGGWGASGIGPPEHGPTAHEFFTRIQTVYRV